MNPKLLACFLVLLASCREVAVNEDSPESPRQFAPRLLAVPNAARVRVEVSNQPFSNTNSNSLVAQGEADWSAGGLQIQGLPTGSLWFRVSGLDANRAPLWSSTGTVPEGTTSQVDIGGSNGNPVTSAPSISLSASTVGDRVVLFCGNSGYHPVWTQGNSSPAPGGTYQQNLNASTEVEIPMGGRITARCTDGFTWGEGGFWNWDNNPSPTDPDLSSAGTELGSVTINAPVGIAGYVTFSANPTRSDIPSMQVAVRTGGSGAFTRQPLATSIQVSTATKVEAYLLGWSAVAHRWLKGPLQTSLAGSPELRGSGTSFDPPGIQGPTQLGGMVTFSQPNLPPNYQNVKLAVWTSASQTTTLQETNYTFQANDALTVKAYAIAWNTTSSDWFYGKESTLTIPVQSPAYPVATGPADELPQPLATLPPTGSGSVTFSVPATFPSNLSPVKLALKNSQGKWDVYDVSYSLPVNVGSTFSAYLLAWSATDKRWKHGTALSQTVTQANPTTPPSLNAAGSYFSPPDINASGAFPLNVSFTAPSDLPASLSPRQIAYRTAPLGTMPSGTFTYLTDGSTVPISSQMQLEACMVAWDASNATWRVGRSKSISVTGGLPVGDPNLNLGGGTDLDAPQVSLPTSLPGYLQAYVPSLSADQVEAKVAYQLGNTGIWNTIKPGDKILINSPVQVTSFVVAWSTSQQRWLYGRPKSFYVDPIGTSLTPPTFTDVGSGALGSVMEVMGLSFTINASATTGSVYYTLDGSTPAPGTTTTKLWTSGTILQIPTGTDSLLVRAVAWDGSRVSAETRLVAHLPRWKLVDSRDLGCIVSTPDHKVFACGDHTGPKIMMDTGWMDLVRGWSLPAAQTLHVNDSEVVAGVEGEVWRIRKFASAPERIGTVDLGWVYALSRFGGDLWASTDNLTVVYYADAWRHQATPQEPLGTGPLWTDGSYLYQGSGDVVVKYAWDASQLSNNWFDWGTKASNIRAFEADSFSTLRDGFVVATEDAVYQWSSSTPGTLGRSIYDASIQGIEGIAWGPGSRLYMAFTNTNGEGGVRRSPGWVSGWNQVALGWPGAAEGTPTGAKGVGVYRRTDGYSQVIGSTPRGTYAVKLVVP